MSNGCGAPAGGSAGSVDTSGQAVVSGRVTRAGDPVSGAYVRLLDSSGEFAGEVPTGTEGRFRFFAASGTWTVRALAAGGATAQDTVTARFGTETELDLAVA